MQGGVGGADCLGERLHATPVKPLALSGSWVLGRGAVLAKRSTPFSRQVLRWAQGWKCVSTDVSSHLASMGDWDLGNWRQGSAWQSVCCAHVIVTASVEFNFLFTLVCFLFFCLFVFFLQVFSWSIWGLILNRCRQNYAVKKIFLYRLKISWIHSCSSPVSGSIKHNWIGCGTIKLALECSIEDVLMADRQQLISAP